MSKRPATDRAVLMSIDNSFEREIAINWMSAQAREVGINITGFRRMLKQYQEQMENNQKMVYANSTTSFTGQDIELDCGEWTANDWEISRRSGMGGVEVACCHPVLPIERLVNIDTGIEKLKIAFARGRRWRELIAERKVLASNNSILQLADMGLAVTSENSRALVRYLSDVENLNYDIIPERKSVSRLGYIKDEGFSPYVDELVFDGDVNFRSIFESIRSSGSREKWLAHAKDIRKRSVPARMVLAAAFASALIDPCGALPFFVHLWGVESGTGKTVALMLSASVWGNPELGRYIQTFNSTVVGREKLAAFLNHLPLMADELQLSKDNRGKMQFDVYALAEGVGRTRGTKSGGIDRTSTWANTIITTGESPITGAGSGAGAINRVIEIECSSSDKIIEDGHATAALLKKNYGYAGREFVEKLYSDDNAERAAELYKKNFKALSENDTTEKQAMAAAILLTADQLATEWIFKDDCALQASEITAFLASKAAVSAGRRGYMYMCDWVAQNSSRLPYTGKVENGDVYGLLEDDGSMACIISSVFRKALEDGGFSSAAVMSYLKGNKLIETRGKNMTRGRRIGGVNTECVCLKIGGADIEEDLPQGWIGDIINNF